ncbi:hypothetical protein STRDD11_00278 [Streptococcus sp. DD11]|nr:hypothetical protein STRDD11_00278 [Streptococcus sp. DD11]
MNFLKISTIRLSEKFQKKDKHGLWQIPNLLDRSCLLAER